MEYTNLNIRTSKETKAAAEKFSMNSVSILLLLSIFF